MNIHWITFQKKVHFFIGLFLVAALSVFDSVRTAQAVEIYDVGAFLHSPSVGSQSLGFLDGQFNDFSSTGISLGFSKTIDAMGYGKLQWSFANNTGTTLADTWLFGFLDAEIDPDLNSSYNESGRLVGVHGTGSGDEAPDSWEIDEPGFSFGDIFDHLFLGSLDNSNAIPAGQEQDVSLALGFYLGNLFAGDSWLLTLNISPFDIGGLAHFDQHSGTEFFLNGTAVVTRSTSVPEPASTMLVLLGFISLFFKRRFFIK